MNTAQLVGDFIKGNNYGFEWEQFPNKACMAKFENHVIISTSHPWNDIQCVLHVDDQNNIQDVYAAARDTVQATMGGDELGPHYIGIDTATMRVTYVTPQDEKVVYSLQKVSPVQ